MSKPKRLREAAVDGQAGPATASSGRKRRAQGAESGKTILICEDEPSLRELVRAVLGPGYRYVEAIDGSAALDLARSESPDLVILDLMLPQVSGFEVLATIRGDARLRHTPVVVLTAWSHVQAEAEAIGADRFISKPFQPDELEVVVEELLAR
jgi:DNA-binding response OmpR family regulator